MATSPDSSTPRNLLWRPAGVECCQVSHRRLTVLLCSRHNQRTDASILQDLDYNVVHAVNAQHATALLQDSKSLFDVALIDDSEFGSEFASADAKAVFAAAADSSTPVVLMCQQPCSADAVVPAVQAGAADILQRPLSRSKLQILWQYVVRAAITHSTSTGTYVLPTHHQQQHHHPSATFMCDALVPTHDQVNSDGFNLLDEGEILGGLGHGDGLGGLDLPPFMPTQADLDPLHAVLADLQEEEVSHVALAGFFSAALPPGSPSTSFAGTAVSASMFSCGDHPDVPGSLDTAALDLDMCNDVSSAQPYDDGVNKRRKLQACTSLCNERARWTTGVSCEQQRLRRELLAGNAPWPQSQPCIGELVAMPGAKNINMMPDWSIARSMCAPPNTGSFQVPASGMGCGSSYPGPYLMPPPVFMGRGPWPAPALLPKSDVLQLPPGMVWGMPIWNVAVAPGITQTSHASCTPAAAGAPPLPHAPAVMCGSVVASQGTSCSLGPAEMHLPKAPAASQYPVPTLPLPPPSATGFWPMTTPCWPMASV